MNDSLPLVKDLIQWILWCITIGGVLWRFSSVFSKMQSKIDTLEKDMNRLDMKVSDIDNASESMDFTLLNSINELKIAIAKVESKLEELKNG